jgi:hypothetical protein
MSTDRYHYLISGLPDLHLEQEKVWTTVTEFKKQLEFELHPEDYEQVKLVFLRKDHENLLEFLKSGTVDESNGANYSLQDYKAQVDLFSAIIPQPDILPTYMADELREYSDDKDFNSVECSQELAESYHDYLMEHGGSFIREYTRLEYDIANLLTYLESRNHAMDPGEFLTGDSALTSHLREHLTKSMTKPADFDLFTEIICYAELPSIVEKEMKYDQLRWRLIDELLFFEAFTVDRVLGYLYQLMMIERWADLDEEKGEAQLRKIIKGAQEFAFSGTAGSETK